VSFILQKLSSLSASDWAAWWGAILATVVFSWDIVKWLGSGPRLRVRSAPEMQMENERGGLDPEKYITFSVVNVGDAPTTVTHLLLTYYSSWLRRLLRRASREMIVARIHLAPPLPKLLSVGDTWTGAMLQTPEIDKMLSDGLLYCGVRDESSSDCTLARIVPKK
jgi:hypothetical protein